MNHPLFQCDSSGGGMGEGEGNGLGGDIRSSALHWA